MTRHNIPEFVIFCGQFNYTPGRQLSYGIAVDLLPRCLVFRDFVFERSRACSKFLISNQNIQRAPVKVNFERIPRLQ